ncbi:hypothetical protein PYCCODRAFT_1429533 [Trametes coccinea BRFM310]|uniref:Uncharacterized protein n=1 Tax=Trametes coccinea (strain BRFM310) TaxID=1353009 RepID=A0A1Y2J886_TRAC3|nr:hypothetical protein PYCCODRAFT_1429533 [Trametes coccinea BRFM310]
MQARYKDSTSQNESTTCVNNLTQSSSIAEFVSAKNIDLRARNIVRNEGFASGVRAIIPRLRRRPCHLAYHNGNHPTLRCTRLRTVRLTFSKTPRSGGERRNDVVTRGTGVSWRSDMEITAASRCLCIAVRATPTLTVRQDSGTFHVSRLQAHSSRGFSISRTPCRRVCRPSEYT